MKPLLATFTFATLATFAFLQQSFAEPLQIEFLGTRGNGCPAGSYTYAMTADGSALSVLFNNFVAEVSPQTNVRTQSNCDMTFRLHLQPGYGLGIVNAEYRGFTAMLGASSRAAFESSWNLHENGQPDVQSPQIHQVFRAPMNENFYIQNPSPNVQWLGCQTREARLNLKANMIVSARRGDQATIAIDSMDASTGLKYYFSVRPCQ